MIKVKARIKLYKDERCRKTPFVSGYRPLFNFIPEMKTSGQITLLDRKEFFPGDEGVVEIAFLHKELLGGNFGEGTKFTFGEGMEPLGDGEIIEVK
jgi:translation elongation factor EF-Tu-like GTPase